MFRPSTLLWLAVFTLSSPLACQPDPSAASPPTRATATPATATPSAATPSSSEPGRTSIAPPDSACDPHNDPYETSGCRCQTDRDCTCRFYDGESFANRAEQSRCLDSGRCVQCIYD